MKMKLCVLLSAMVLASGSAFATTFDECLSLWSFYGGPKAATYQSIQKYAKTLADNPADYYANLALGMLYCTLALPPEEAEQGAVERVLEYTDKFLKKEPDNPLALVINGTGHGVFAGRAGNAMAITKEIFISIQACDKAVNKAAGKPYEWYIRFMRANYYAHMEDRWKKKEIAQGDYQFVEAASRKNPTIERSLVVGYFYLGEMAKSSGNLDKAAGYWKKSVSLADKYNDKTWEGRTARERVKTLH